MSDNFSVRYAAEEDIDAIFAIEKVCFSQPWSRRSFRDSLDNGNVLFLLAEFASAPVGFCVVYYLFEDADIANIAVLPEYKRRGIARAMLGHVIKELAERGVSVFNLEVRESNTPAIQLYKSFGFEQIAVRRSYYKNPCEDALVMTLKK